MIDIEVIHLPRGAGKTTQLMDLMHAFIVDGNRNSTDVLVILPSIGYLSFWTRMWRDRYSIPLPRYCTISDTTRIRGAQVQFIGIEDIDTYEDGIRDERIFNVWPVYRPVGDNGIVAVTSSPIELNDKPYSVTPPAKTKQEILLEGIRKARQLRALKTEWEVSAIMAKIIVDSDDKDLIDGVLSGAIAPVEAIRLLESKGGH